MGKVSKHYATTGKWLYLRDTPPFAVWSAVFIGADLTSPVALYLPLWTNLEGFDLVTREVEVDQLSQQVPFNLTESVKETIFHN